MNKEEKQKLSDEIFKNMQELEEIGEVEKLISDNTLPFSHNEQIYRMRRPSQEEKIEGNEIRRKTYIKMLQDPTYKTRKQLIELLKEKGIDIDKMESKMATLNAEIKRIQLELAQISDKKIVEDLKNNILGLMRKLQDVSMEKSEYLEYSLEDQLDNEINAYFTYMLLDTRKDTVSEWRRAFNKFEDFKKCNDNRLILKSNYYLTCLLYSDTDLGVIGD